jgi:hypothetical protein
MDDKEVKEILEDPKKLLNILRLFHQLLHVYDEKELRKEMEKRKSQGGGTTESAGLGDEVSVVVTDAEGNIKQNLTQ